MPVDARMWTEQELERDRIAAIAAFRAERLSEPAELFGDAVDAALTQFESLLEATVDLTLLQDPNAIRSILQEDQLVTAFRYLAGPPISVDDLKTLSELTSLRPSRLTDEELLRLKDTVLACFDRRRFPWVVESREPNEHERNAAILASAVLAASQKVQTNRRQQGKRAQEAAVERALREGLGFKSVPPLERIEAIQDAPRPGEFCGETSLGRRKADFLVGLYDSRIAPIECKVSNSELNSLKRLNNDAAAKATEWINEFGTRNVVPIAVLSGAYKLENLLFAQECGLRLIWAHRLSDLVDWVRQTRQPG